MLDWTDTADRDQAIRGFVDRLDPCVIRDSAGRTIWDGDRWDFLAGDCPSTAHPGLWRQGGLNAVHGLFEVAEDVYQVRGLDCSNMTIVEGESGVVVIDPLSTPETAAAALGLYRRNRGERPVTAVLYSHSHADHFGGVRGVLDGDVPVVAPSGFMDHAVSENIFAGPAMSYRAAYQYGLALPAGPAGSIGFGLAQAIPAGVIGLVPPTVSITETGQELTLDGVRIVFQLTPDTEAPSEMNFYLPEQRVLLVAENANHTMHNILTLRGALVRDAQAWAGYLTETIQLFCGDAEILIGSHNWPTWGRDAVIRMLSEQRDTYAYLHDQTVRLMNRGLTGAEIAEELSDLPQGLDGTWHNRGFYGSLSHNVKAVYQRYMGWFDGNPAHLWQHPPVEAGRRYVEYMGGPDAVVAMARKSFADGDLRWVAEVLNHVVFAHPEHAEARELQARTFERLAYGAENGTWRNFYLSGAQELRSTERPKGGMGNSLNPEMVAALSARQLFQSMAVRLDGPRAAGRRLVLRWELTDTGESWTLLLANSVLTPLRGGAPGDEEPQVTLRLTRASLDRVLAGRADPADEAAVEGDATALTALFDLLERPIRSFPIATP